MLFRVTLGLSVPPSVLAFADPWQAPRRSAPITLRSITLRRDLRFAPTKLTSFKHCALRAGGLAQGRRQGPPKELGDGVPDPNLEFLR